MSSQPVIDRAAREAILRRPDAILDDRDLMRALFDANQRAMGENVVDLRGLAMDRLEARLDRLEDTHRSVIAAAYDNLAGTNQLHRAILRMMEAGSFEAFLRDLAGPVRDILRLDAVRLVLSTRAEAPAADLSRFGGVLAMAPPEFLDAYTGGPDGSRAVTLRRVEPGSGATIYGAEADTIRSEACLRLDLGSGRLPGLLLLGSCDENLFSPQHGTDLLTFFAGVFERQMRQWLA